jgi:phosphoglycolate phosphatase-like HAD superfamily hydrolase
MPNQPRKPIVLVDVDGTLADVGHRLRHIQGAGPKNWKAFFEGIDSDPPIASTVAWVRSLAENHEIVIITGRPERYRRRTIAWLKKNAIPFSDVFMRTDGDHRPDYEVKKEALRRWSKQRIKLVIEDRPPVCEMWLSQGIRCVLVHSDEASQAVNEIYREKS